jgi:putative DNA primase/helicase
MKERSMYNPTPHRLQLLANGYRPIPNLNKICMRPGWNSAAFVAQELTDGYRGETAIERVTSWVERHSLWMATGVRLDNGLGAIDGDVDNEALSTALWRAIDKHAPDVGAQAPCRFGGGSHKFALFVRIEGGAFAQVPHHVYTKPGQGTHTVEIFGGAATRGGHCDRQFGVYGPHSHNADGSVARMYAWADDKGLHNTPFTMLPTLTKAQALDIVGEFERAAEALGWLRATAEEAGEAGAQYTIDETTTFLTTHSGGERIDYVGLCAEFYAYGAELRCSVDFLPGRGDGGKVSHCQVGADNRHGCVAVFVYGDNATHFPVAYEPVDMAGATAALKDLEKATGQKAPGVEKMPPAVMVGRLSDTVDQAAKVLIEAGVPFYQRGGTLVRPATVDAKTFDEEDTLTTSLVEVDVPYLRDTLCRVSRWFKFDKRSTSWVATSPSIDVCAVLLSKYGDWPFRVLGGVIHTPTMRPDGSILSEPGYDEATQLLLLNPPDMPAIPENPTRDDALASLGVLKDLLSEFPFIDDGGVSAAVALSAQISTVCRGAFSVVPMHVVDAPAAGTGKSYLISTVSWVATGRAMPVMSAGKTPEETEKRLASAVVCGQSLICIDNVEGELGGDALCQLIEQPRPTIRILGRTERVEIDGRSLCIFANGNNIVTVGDVWRREVKCRMEAAEERPEQRQFTKDPRAMILADRGKYIAACLVIVRAYVVAGRPGKQPQIASFNGWSDTVRSALMWLGEADPVVSMEEARSEDPRLTMLHTLLDEWSSSFGRGPRNAISLKDVVAKCDARVVGSSSSTPTYINITLRSAVLATMPAGRDQVNVNSLGLWMRAFRDKKMGGMSFKQVDGKARVVKWYVDGDAAIAENVVTLHP